MGLRLPSVARTALHIAFAVALLCQALVPSHVAVCVTLVLLSVVIASFPVRLSNHLVVAWALSLMVVVQWAQPAGGMLRIVGITYLLAGFAKANRTYLFSEQSCGRHFARVLTRNWGLKRFAKSHFLARSATWGIMMAELACGLALAIGPGRVMPWGVLLGILLAIVFGWLCH